VSDLILNNICAKIYLFYFIFTKIYYYIYLYINILKNEKNKRNIIYIYIYIYILFKEDIRNRNSDNFPKILVCGELIAFSMDPYFVYNY